jgi:hypothetical protein
MSTSSSPALYRAGLGAVCCSMPVCVTDDGVEPLVGLETELLVVD